MTDSRSPAAEYLRFLAWVVTVSAGVAALGYLPTRRLAGEAGVAAMLAGCALGVVASAAGGIAVWRWRRVAALNPAQRLQAMLASMGLRLAALAILGAAAAFSGGFEREPLLLWIAISYLALLAVDTWYAVRGF